MFRILFLLTIAVAMSQSVVAQTQLPVVTVVKHAHDAGEETAADETGRPDWTSSRRFGRTRIYLQKAPWEVGFEQWARIRDFRDGTKQVRFQEEIELGLPYRFQFDLYEKWVVNERKRAHHDEMSF